ncbi:MAG: hypothetical protein NTV87_13210 [Ignavibacteriae bacterium]|nr:hypothetical protein [Ignavibacteriota bacterium]
MAKFNLDPGEKELHNQTLFYEPPKAGKYNGKLIITDKRLLFDAKINMSASGMLEEVFFIKSGSEGFIEIPKNRIANTEVQKSTFAKKVIVTTDDGNKHTFNSGMLNIDKAADAIKTK